MLLLFSSSSFEFEGPRPNGWDITKHGSSSTPGEAKREERFDMYPTQYQPNKPKQSINQNQKKKLRQKKKKEKRKKKKKEKRKKRKEKKKKKKENQII
jgi:hypothetical protein